MSNTERISDASQEPLSSRSAPACDAVTVVARGAVRAEFYRVGDRYAHRLIVCVGDTAVVALQSQEGDAHQAAPPSPPLQEVHLHRQDDVPGGAHAVLAVGMAGTSHWSLAVDSGPVDSGPVADELVFDVACRYKQRPEPLGSRYRVGAGCRWERPDRYRMSLGLPGGGRLEIVGSRDAPGTHCRWDEQDETLIIVPAEDEGLRAGTMRWRYAVRWLAQ